MGYLFLAIVLIAGTTKGYCGKRTSGYVTKLTDAMQLNMLRMILCVVIGFVVLLIGGNIAGVAVPPVQLFIMLLSGVSTSLFVVSWLLAVRTGAYMMLDVFLMVGTIIPMIGCSCLYGESIAVNQWVGFAILVLSAVIMCSYNNSIKAKISIKSLALLFLCAICNGLTDFSQKLYVNDNGKHDITVFNFYTYLFSAAVLIIFYFVFKAADKDKTPKVNKTKAYKFVAVMSVCLFIYSFFKTMAADMLPAVILYPLSQGGGLILSTIMAAALFKEKLTAKCVIGLVLAFVGLLVINCFDMFVKLF